MAPDALAKVLTITFASSSENPCCSKDAYFAVNNNAPWADLSPPIPTVVPRLVSDRFLSLFVRSLFASSTADSFSGSNLIEVACDCCA